jgi:signal transduction histidine kinase
MARARDPVLVVAVAALVVVAALVTSSSLGWVGKPFPGFLVLENRVIASAGLSRWPAVADGAIYQREIVAVDGATLDRVEDLERRVAAAPPGTPFRYRLSDGADAREVAIATRTFERADWWLLFGTYLFCGVGLCAIALVIRHLRGGDLLARVTFPTFYIAGMWALTAMDLYGPYRLFRVHALGEALLAPGLVHVALVFPTAAGLLLRWPRLPLGTYAAGVAFALFYQLGLHDPDRYRTAHGAAQVAIGLSLCAMIVSQVGHWVRARDFLTRQRVKVVAVGTALAMAPQVVLSFFGAVTGTDAPQNALAFSGMLFPLSISYAVLRHNLLGVDEFVRRALNYAVLSLGIVALYALAIAASDALFQRSPLASRGFVAYVIGPASVLALLPLRDRMQSGIDRLFFRSAYDFRRVVETASARLASVSDLSVISFEVHRAVDDSLQPAWVALYVHSPALDALECVDSSCPDAETERALLARAGGMRDPFDGDDGALGVPFRAESGLVAVLLLGRRLSGRFYGGDDRRLLHTLSNQGAVAIENALALVQLRELNRDLEGKVAERTRDLASALHELRETQAQLVHREKMASVGAFVAGIAHEMNNPLAFIEGNLHFLKSYAATLNGAIGSYETLLREQPELAARIAAIRDACDLDHVQSDLAGVLDGCAEGVSRTTSLVKDLRTFSRLDHADVLHADLHEALDSTLNLLRSRLGGIEVARAYGALPAVECLAGQLNQVFMNLLANAADAAGEGGRITVRTRVDGDRAVVEVEDDGPGVPAEHLERIFDPFFTTKEPGQGTGLGLAISYGIVARHRGALSVRNGSGGGACFRVEIPLRWCGDLASESHA